MKKFFVIFFIILMTVQTANASGTIATYVIDPEKNAYQHNNMGIIYVEEKNYYAAIQEFKTAISLNPDTQATAAYFYNLGKVYMTIGYPGLAEDCFQNSIKHYPLNFEYYKGLADCYGKLGKAQSKLQEYKTAKKTSLDNVILGLLYEQNGDIKKAIFVLDDFTAAEPALLITPAVKQYIQTLVNTLRG